jgi:hypothetical protein
LPQKTQRQLTCDRVNFANSLLNFADNLDAGGDKALTVAGASALAALATSETVVGGIGFGGVATFSGAGGLLAKTVSSGVSLVGHTIGSLATNNRSAFQNTFMNGVLGSASSGRGGIAGSLIEGGVQDAANQPVPDRYTCP